MSRTGRSIDGSGTWRASNHLEESVGRNADKDTDELRWRRGTVKAAAMQCLVAALEKHPLLRVHQRRLASGDGKVSVVKQVAAVHKAAMGQTRTSGLRKVLWQVKGIPARGCDASDGVGSSCNCAHCHVREGQTAGQHYSQAYHGGSRARHVSGVVVRPACQILIAAGLDVT